MPVIIPITPGATLEGFVLDPDGIAGVALDLGTIGGTLRLSSLSIPPAQKLPTWAASGDSDGSHLVRTPYYQNRECTMQVRVNAADGDAAMTALGQLETKLQEADRRAQDGGLPALWTPAGSSVGLRLYILLAQITDMPVTVADGWFASKPIVTVAFTAKPFLYGTETSIAAVTSSLPLVTITVPSVPGDVAAEARLVMSDTASQARRYVEWGLEQFYYNAGTPAPLFIDSASLVASGFAGASHSNSGAYGGATLSSTLYANPVAVCGTGAQSHIGSFRAKARVYAASTSQYWRLSWQQGDGAWTSNDWAVPLSAAGFSEIDLGMVTITPAVEGAQQWSGRVEAYSTLTGDSGEIDYLLLYPVDEGYGRLAATYNYVPGVTVRSDNFDAGTTGVALNGTTAPTGGTWATSGATTDFAFIPEPFYGNQTVTRSTTAAEAGNTPRFAILGTGGLTDTEVYVAIRILIPGAPSAAGYSIISRVIARWTDSSNFLSAALVHSGTGDTILRIYKRVGGSDTILAERDIRFTDSYFQIRMIAYASGRVLAWLFDSGNGTLIQLDAHDSAVATGGALAAGAAGFSDRNALLVGTAANRYYDNFYAAIPAAEPLIVHTGRTLDIRSDSNMRQSTDGLSYGDITSRGSRLFIPPGGGAGRTTRIVARAARDDITTAADTAIGDSLQAHLFYTPRYLAVPRT